MTYDTDKIRSGIIEEYEKFFASIKDSELKYLEIGVFKGGSLLWAKDFFPKGKIYGIDLVPLELKDIVIEIVDQQDSDGLKKFSEEYGKFDIIVDDGCHRVPETKNAFESLWPYLNVGGIYVIEDWAACFLPNEKFLGMDKLVTDIASRKDVIRIDIVRKNYSGSMAFFRKGKDVSNI